MPVIEIPIQDLFSTFSRQRRQGTLLSRSCQRLRSEQTALVRVVEQTKTFTYCTSTRFRGRG